MLQLLPKSTLGKTSDRSHNSAGQIDLIATAFVIVEHVGHPKIDAASLASLVSPMTAFC